MMLNSHCRNVSSIKTYLECQKKAYYSHDLRRAPKNSYSPALYVGTVWHKLMEVKLLGHGKEAEDEAVANALAAAKEAAEAGISPADRQTRGRAVRELVALVGGYTRYVVPPDWRVCSVERIYSGLVPFHEAPRHSPGLDAIPPRVPGEAQTRTSPGYQVVIIPDAVVEWNGLYWHVQHKTVDKHKNLPLFWRKMERDWHECLYEHVLRQNGFTPYGGTLLLTARKVDLKTAEEAPESIIQHQFITRPERIVRRAADDMYLLMKEWGSKLENARVAGGPGSFIENRDACFGTFGNSPCPYLSVCHDGADIHDDDHFVTITDRYENLG